MRCIEKEVRIYLIQKRRAADMKNIILASASPRRRELLGAQESLFLYVQVRQKRILPQRTGKSGGRIIRAEMPGSV